MIQNKKSQTKSEKKQNENQLIDEYVPILPLGKKKHVIYSYHADRQSLSLHFLPLKFLALWQTDHIRQIYLCEYLGYTYS